jgi:hypothetical protein
MGRLSLIAIEQFCDGLDLPALLGVLADISNWRARLGTGEMDIVSDARDWITTLEARPDRFEGARAWVRRTLTDNQGALSDGFKPVKGL